MATPADDLPAMLDSHEVAAALGQSLYRTQAQLRDGLLPGVKLPGGRWRCRREDIKAILAGEPGLRRC